MKYLCLLLSVMLLGYHGVVSGQTLVLAHNTADFSANQQYSVGSYYTFSDSTHHRTHRPGKVIGTGVILLGTAAIAATAVFIIVREASSKPDNPKTFSTGEVNAAAGTIIGGIGLILLGDCICHRSLKHERDGRFSLQSTRNTMGLAYHF